MYLAAFCWLTGLEVSFDLTLLLRLEEPADVREVFAVKSVLLALDQILRPFEDRDDGTLLLF